MNKGEAARRRAKDDSRELMAKVKEGDRRAFDLLARNYANMVITLASKILSSREEAMDCAQDAFVRAWQNAARYDPKWSVATWLRRIVTNLALDRLRRRGPRAEFTDALAGALTASTEGPEEAIERNERALGVRDVLETLPEKYRLVLVLRDMENLDIADIADITGSNPATVRWRLHRARSLFKDRWLSSGRE